MNEPEHNCLNCGVALHGEYCSSCGQRDKNFHVPLKELAHEFGEEIFSFDERLLRSLTPFLLKPGFLTLEYLSGKRKRYISPFKLYFFLSFLFFFTSTLNDTNKKNISDKNIIATDSLKPSIGTDSIFASIKEEKSGLRFTVADSAKAEKVFGRSFINGLEKMKSNPQPFFDKIREHRPKVIFILLPVFALLLKLMYVRSKIFYSQHIVFAFYFHAFIFFILLITDLLELTGWSFLQSYADVLVLAIPINLYLGLKQVYRQSRGKTLTKFLLLVASYGIVFLVVILLATLTLILFL